MVLKVAYSREYEVIAYGDGTYLEAGLTGTLKNSSKLL